MRIAKSHLAKEASTEMDREHRADGELSVDLAVGTDATILAAGADSAGRAALYRGRRAVLTPVVGDLATPAAYQLYLEHIAGAEAAHGLRPTHVAVDLHPQFLSRRYAESLGLTVIGVQHHHAHAAAVMAEHALDGAVIAVCCDGMGWGTDGTAWGCEALRCDLGRFERVGGLEPIALVGNDAAAIETWRPAAAMMRQAFGPAWPSAMRRVVEARGEHGCDVARHDLAIAARYLESGLPKVMASSLGRVFDGVSFLLGLCSRNDSPARAAVALEDAASGDATPYPYETALREGFIRMSVAPMVRALCRGLSDGVPIGVMASRFHETIARMLATTAELAAARSGLMRVVLAGGCWANRRLRARVTELLSARRLRVFAAERLPCGDEGIALGQAVIAGRVLLEQARVSDGGG